MPPLISVVFCLKPRARGQSALFDSLNYLSSTASSYDHTIIGWTGELPNDPTLSSTDRQHVEWQLTTHQKGHLRPVWLFDSKLDPTGTISFRDQRRWRRYGEHVLYSLFHYQQLEPSDGRNERDWWQDYCRMNELFAKKIVECYTPGALIWIHDYQLLLLPGLLRQSLPQAKIGFFLHVPFPSSEYLRCLDHRKELLESMLASNLIGLQCNDYCRHFASCCKRLLVPKIDSGHPQLSTFETTPIGVVAFGAHIAVDAFPMGINAAGTEDYALSNPAVLQKLQDIKTLFGGMKIIVGRDRLDPMRGVAQKLQAFETFLLRYPHWRGKVVLVQVTSPATVEEEHAVSVGKEATRISDLVTKINGTYGSLSFSPVHLYTQFISKEEYFALLRAADVGLITSIRDGISTTSLEFIVSQKDSHGSLLLSEFSGTAESLRNATLINPWNLEGVAQDIHRALMMSNNDRRAQSTRLYNHVSLHNVQTWADNFLHRLSNTAAMYGETVMTPPLDRQSLRARYQASKCRLFMFDYDGTLTPIVTDPASALPTNQLLDALKLLAANPKNQVWIISGRDQTFLEKWMGSIHALGLSAEHGSFIRHPMEQAWENVTKETDMSWQEEVMQIFEDFTAATAGSNIERKKVAVTWHYRRADPEYGLFQAQECQNLLEATVTQKWDIEVIRGKANLEVRPVFVNKGRIVVRLLSEFIKPSSHQHVAEPDFVFCVGDDHTDEDMFRSLKDSGLPGDNVFTCTVGAKTKPTQAKWHLLESSDVLSTIDLLVQSDEDDTRPSL
ncbi:MAG: threalose-6-phosphate phosphatase [Chrysothrix sp. TS-e1954]|nr:MAG: threalose-6-phosphate phosphatase [Chrysothrix sp. TS-e1954]